MDTPVTLHTQVPISILGGEVNAHFYGFKGFDKNNEHFAVRAGEPAVAMLRALDVHRCRLLTNNPDKVKQLRDGGIDVVSSVPTGVFLTKHNHNYLRSKVSKSSHTIKL